MPWAAKNEQLAVFSDTISNVFNHSENKPEIASFDALDDRSIHPAGNQQSALDTQLESAEADDRLHSLSDIYAQNLGQTLESLHQALNKQLFYEIQQGNTLIEKDQDWLTIELSSSLMFLSGSAVPTSRAVNVLQTLLPILNAKPQLYSHPRLYR